MAKGFSCHKRGHIPMDGWMADPPRQNDSGHWFVTRVCRGCHSVYVEFIPGMQVSGLLGIDGRQQVTQVVQ